MDRVSSRVSFFRCNPSADPFPFRNILSNIHLFWTPATVQAFRHVIIILVGKWQAHCSLPSRCQSTIPYLVSRSIRSKPLCLHNWQTDCEKCFAMLNSHALFSPVPLWSAFCRPRRKPVPVHWGPRVNITYCSHYLAVSPEKVNWWMVI